MMIQSKTNNHLSLINNHLAFGISTTVVSALQINSFMQNKAKFRKSQMNVNSLITAGYENKTLGERGKKQSQTNPNKAKFKKAQMNVTSIITVDYENKSPIIAPKKQSQISKRQKPMQNSLLKGIMKKTRSRVPKKQTQYKAKQSQFKSISEAKMLLRMTINTRRNPLRYNADEIAPNAYDRLTKKFHGQYPVFICELCSRLDFDYMLEFSQI